MMNSSLGGVDAAQNYYGSNDTNDSYDNPGEITTFDSRAIALIGIILIICCIGFVGNGYIIWLLGFQIKRNGFTTFILNLAVTDFGYLTSMFIYILYPFIHFQGSGIFYIIWDYFSHVMYINTHFLMMAISIDRCVAVFFPIWHRCSQPKHLSCITCALLWISCFLLGGILSLMKVFGKYPLLHFHVLVTAIICLPLITLSTVVLFIKGCLKSNQKNQGRLLLMILITLLSFLILAFPLSVLAVIANFSSTDTYIRLRYWLLCGMLFSCLNSSINLVIYFLVGKRKGARTKESMKVILQKVFKEGESDGDGGATEEKIELRPNLKSPAQ